MDEHEANNFIRRMMGPGRRKIEELEARMASLGISKKEIEEKFIRSSGKGGQNVNKVNTACQLRHLPTGMISKCGRERSQNLNRFLALRALVDRIEEKRGGPENRKSIAADKIRKRKKRRARRANAKYS